MRTVLLLAALWGGTAVAGLRGWVSRRPGERHDAQLRALLSGAVVPAPRSPQHDTVARSAS